MSNSCGSFTDITLADVLDDAQARGTSTQFECVGCNRTVICLPYYMTEDERLLCGSCRGYGPPFAKLVKLEGV